MKNQAQWQRRLHRGLRWALGVAVSLMVLIVVGTTIYVHMSPVPTMLTLPREAGSGSSSGSRTVASSGGATAAGEGVWNAAPGSIVGWRVPQVFIGQQLPLVSRTDQVWGSITVVNESVTRGTFTVDMVALTSSLSKTTQRTVFNISTYPTVKVTLTSPIALGTIPSDGTVERFPATANLTMHGVTHVVHFTVSVEHFGGDVYVLADITFPYGDWKIAAQGVPFLADLQSPATIEVLLHLTQGPGNPPSVAASGRSRAGGIS